MASEGHPPENPNNQASEVDELMSNIKELYAVQLRKAASEKNAELCQKVARLEADLDATIREKSELSARYNQLDQEFKKDKKEHESRYALIKQQLDTLKESNKAKDKGIRKRALEYSKLEASHKVQSDLVSQKNSAIVRALHDLKGISDDLTKIL